MRPAATDVRPLVIAHRACPRHAPENSLAGIRRAADLGADAVEVDVRLTLDGVPVLLHDWSLRRTTGRRGPVWLRSSARVGQLAIGDGERVPTFAAALDALPPGLRMAIDVKVPRAIHPVLDEVRNQQADARVMIWSRHPSVVRFSADRRPGIESTLLRDTRTAWGRRALLRAARRCGAHGISPGWDAITPDFVARVRDQGLVCYAWCRTPDPPRATLALLDGVVTDWPDEIRRLVDR